MNWLIRLFVFFGDLVGEILGPAGEFIDEYMDEIAPGLDLTEGDDYEDLD